MHYLSIKVGANCVRKGVHEAQLFDGHASLSFPRNRNDLFLVKSLLRVHRPLTKVVQDQDLLV
jgi:hypothetical protein